MALFGLDDDIQKQALLMAGLGIMQGGAAGQRTGQALGAGLQQGLAFGLGSQRERRKDQAQRKKEDLLAKTESLRQQGMEQQMAMQEQAQQQALLDENRLREQQAQQQALLSDPGVQGEDFARQLSTIQNNPQALINFQNQQAQQQAQQQQQEQQMALQQQRLGLQEQGQNQDLQLAREQMAQRAQLQQQEQDFLERQQQQEIQQKIATAQTKPEKLTAQQEKDRFTAQTMAPAVQGMIQSLQSGFDPTSIFNLPGKLLGPALQGPEAEQFYSNGEKFLSQYIFKQSGAAATDTEVARASKAWLPQIGDSKTQVNRKMHSIQNVMNSLLEGGKLPQIGAIGDVIKEAKDRISKTAEISGLKDDEEKRLSELRSKYAF